MSLPNDDENGRPPWRDPYGPRGGAAVSPIKKLTVASSSDADDRTADETSIGSMSFSSDTTSIATAMGANLLPSTPFRPGNTRSGINETPMSALSDDNSIQSGVSFNVTEDAAATQLRRGQNRRRLQRLGIATGTTFALFVFMLIPTALLLSMILFGSVSSAFLYQLAAITRWEFHRSILEGRGIGDYLPRGLYEVLTSTSLHEFLSDPDGIFGANEHLPYLMLYLIPGLTPEQIDQYVNRLSPTHQQLLRSEQGLLGFFMNRNNHHQCQVANANANANASDGNQDSTLMRVIMGDERLREWRQQQGAYQNHPSNIAPRRLELPPTIPEEDPPTPTSRTMPEEDAPISREDAMSESIPEPPSAGIPAIVAAIVGRGSAAQPSVTIPNPGRQSPERGASIPVDMILFDAVGSAVANFVGDATNAVRQRAQESLREAVTVPIYRLSLGMAALGLGVGAYGLAIGTYDLRSIGELLSNVMSSLLGGGSGGGSSSPRGSGGSASTPWAGLSMLMPSGGLVVGSTIASGTTAVVLGLFGITRTSSNNPGRGDTPPTQTTSNTNNKYQGDPPSQSRKS
jgi:hypothetical protein